MVLCWERGPGLVVLGVGWNMPTAAVLGSAGRSPDMAVWPMLHSNHRYPSGRSGCH